MPKSPAQSFADNYAQRIFSHKLAGLDDCTDEKLRVHLDAYTLGRYLEIAYISGANGNKAFLAEACAVAQSTTGTVSPTVVELSSAAVETAATLALASSNALRVDYSTLSDAELIRLRDAKYGIVNTIGMGEDDPGFDEICDQFYTACETRRIDPGFISVADSALHPAQWLPADREAFIALKNYRKEFCSEDSAAVLLEPFSTTVN